ncbi:hypothetical protein MAP00_001663 [Monascus purpureus]|nr:hypothetical protein MAP00_001663 [Monascus purpureus]
MVAVSKSEQPGLYAGTLAGRLGISPAKSPFVLHAVHDTVLESNRRHEREEKKVQWNGRCNSRRMHGSLAEYRKDRTCLTVADTIIRCSPSRTASESAGETLIDQKIFCSSRIILEGILFDGIIIASSPTHTPSTSKVNLLPPSPKKRHGLQTPPAVLVLLFNRASWRFSIDPVFAACLFWSVLVSD